MPLSKCGPTLTLAENDSRTCRSKSTTGRTPITKKNHKNKQNNNLQKPTLQKKTIRTTKEDHPQRILKQSARTSCSISHHPYRFDVPKKIRPYLFVYKSWRMVDFSAHNLPHFSLTFFPVVPCSDRGFHSWIAGWITYHPKHGWPRLIRQAGLFCAPTFCFTIGANAIIALAGIPCQTSHNRYAWPDSDPKVTLHQTMHTFRAYERRWKKRTVSMDRAEPGCFACNSPTVLSARLFGPNSPIQAA